MEIRTLGVGLWEDYFDRKKFEPNAATELMVVFDPNRGEIAIHQFGTGNIVVPTEIEGVFFSGDRFVKKSGIDHSKDDALKVWRKLRTLRHPAIKIN
ncbi:MAG: hypothetical protein ABII95_01690 [Patescibacteria group bacterium]|nr:hypothetical protein [Patescibacteria group bacterium]MBU2068463.1 hypothetical protein [Patescibacteria group bacterium]